MNTPRRVALLGATGSIGSQTLDVIRAQHERYELVAAVAGRDRAGLDAIASEFPGVATALGAEAATEIAGRDDVDVVVNAIVGAAGLDASLAALEAGRVLALANKESLVAGGDLCRSTAARTGARIVAVDSEHAALAQALHGHDRSSIARIVLTASGGPFREREDLTGVTAAEALQHPNWNMGPKITVDSATMMNKALEVLEAHHLFGFEFDDIDVLIHPESLVHGIVEFVDGSSLMQSAPTDMRVPIAAALSFPERLHWDAQPVRPGRLHFEPADHDRWPALRLGYEAGRRGGTMPAVLNAANEVAVAAFLDERIPFTGIVETVERVMARHEPVPAEDRSAIGDADAWARAAAQEQLGKVVPA